MSWFPHIYVPYEISTHEKSLRVVHCASMCAAMVYCHLGLAAFESSGAGVASVPHSDKHVLEMFLCSRGLGIISNSQSLFSHAVRQMFWPPPVGENSLMCTHRPVAVFQWGWALPSGEGSAGASLHHRSPCRGHEPPATAMTAPTSSG